MARIIAIANQKGGVAKTTTAGTMAAALKDRGFRVLAIDMDPQGNLSDSLGADSYDAPTVYELLKHQNSAKEVIQHCDACDIIPANIMLAGAEQEIIQTGKEHRLKEKIQPILADYDYIIIDTPPALGTLTVNALTVAQELIVPTTTSVLAVKGIRQLRDSMLNAKKYCGSSVRCIGILITRYNSKTNNSKEISELIGKVAEFMDAPVFKTRIRNNVTVEDAQSRSIDILEYRETANAAEDYKKFVDEYLELYGGK